MLDIVAVITVRNGEPYIRRCLEHLIGQDIGVVVVDHDSTDRTRELAEGYVGNGVLSVERLPFLGEFDLMRMLEHKERIIDSTPADWFMHQDVDEIREAPKRFGTLREGIEEADRRGYNAINFEEFAFVPTFEDEDHRNGDYVATMRRYYYLVPAPQSHVKAFKPEGMEFDLKSSGGHRIRLPELRLFPEDFILRHYIGLSRQHLVDKYAKRVYPEEEVNHGWHGFRANVADESIVLPDPSRLKTIGRAGEWDRSDPKWRHEFLRQPIPRDHAEFARRAVREFRRMSGQVHMLSGRLEATRKTLDKREHEIEQLQAERGERRAELDRLYRQARRVAQVRRDYESTLSWRVTRPLRVARRWLSPRGGGSGAGGPDPDARA